MENSKATKKSFANSYPFVHDALCIAVGVFVAGLALSAVQTYVMPAISSLMAPTPEAPKG